MTQIERVRSGWVAELRRFVGARPQPSLCELCSAPAGEPHAHLVETESGRLICCCRPCALLFGERESARYRRVSESIMPLQDFALADEQWEALAIPVAIAFFYGSTKDHRIVACYPGSAGVTRSLLDLEAWSSVVDANPALRTLVPDVEALLVNRMEGASQAFRVPIDRCYALAGLLKLNWRGVAGGESARRVVDDFFDCLRRGEPLASALGHA